MTIFNQKSFYMCIFNINCKILLFSTSLMNSKPIGELTHFTFLILKIFGNCTTIAFQNGDKVMFNNQHF